MNKENTNNQKQYVSKNVYVSSERPERQRHASKTAQPGALEVENYVLVTIFTQKMPEIPDSMSFSIFMLENSRYDSIT